MRLFMKALLFYLMLRITRDLVSKILQEAADNSETMVTTSLTEFESATVLYDEEKNKELALGGANIDSQTKTSNEFGARKTSETVTTTYKNDKKSIVTSKKSSNTPSSFKYVDNEGKNRMKMHSFMIGFVIGFLASIMIVRRRLELDV